MNTYTALDWKRERHTVAIQGRVIASARENNVFLARKGKLYFVYYGLQLTEHGSLTAALTDFGHCLKHAERCE